MSFIDLGLTDKNAGGGCCGGGACMCGHGSASPEVSVGAVTTTIGVAGMTCGHCEKAVTEELSALGGVTGVSVELAPGETSTVTIVSDEPLETAAVRAAVEDAGYAMA
ncbi:Copper chaperone CopZ [Paramicrobacterium humi]|uniref:Copper chaperone CopZ n=1 Tax=Paramicrobacterium humi TaxID=640635 RepID=A0A1H4LD38_9MICO|nr:cation transporter [Microbacterium humi]SEB68624.1 Copper chaperone CopZ [Microbacterium humi]